MDKSLGEYIDELRNELVMLESWELTETLEQTAETYKAMLMFRAKGAEDPNAPQIHNQLWATAISLGQRIKRLRRLKEQPNSRYSIAFREIQAININSLIARVELEKEPALQELNTIQLFKWLWTSRWWTSNDYDLFMQLLTSDTAPDKIKAIMIAAVLLSILDFFDERKMMFLLDAYLIDNPEINQRALVGIILAARKNEDLIMLLPEIKGRLEIFCDDQNFVKNVYNVLIQLQMSAITDRVVTKIRDEIMPTIVKGSAELKKQMGMLEINEKLTENGENPEWLQQENDSKAEKNIREMTEMQLNGEDIYFATFSMLKGFSFFYDISHWFYPFTTNDPALSNIRENLEGDKGKYLRALINNSPFCNSDKYSLCLMLSTTGNGGFDAISNQMASQIDELEEEERNSVLNSSRTKKAGQYSRSFIFDLYRFYNVYNYRREFYNPFAEAKKKPFCVGELKPLSMIGGNCKLLEEHADFLMRKEYYTEAITEFNAYKDNCELTAELCQKLGFCHQALDKTHDAIAYYKMADDIKPNSKWTLSHLAKMCVIEHNYNEAQRYYAQLCEIEEDNIHYIRQYAMTLEECNKLPEAINILYKAYYLAPDSKQVRKQLGTYLIYNKEIKKGIELLDSHIDKGVACIIDNNAPEAYRLLKEAYKSWKDRKTFRNDLLNAAKDYIDKEILSNTDIYQYYDSVILDSDM